MANFTIPQNVIQPAKVVPTGNLIFGASTTPPTPGPGEDACTDCPDYISNAVEAPISFSLQQVRTIKKRSTLIQAALRGIVGPIQAAVQSAMDAIPIPPVFDLSEIINTFTCPLTPVAINLDPSLITQFDPRTLWKQIQDQFTAHLSKITFDYEGTLATLEGADVVRIAKAYYEDMKRTEFDSGAFQYAVAVSVYVLGVCPITHAAGVYAEFDEEVTDFDLTGFVPILSLEAEVRDFMRVLNEGELKLEAWRIAATAPPIF